MPKKLKVVVKSLYSHEIRKDVKLNNLKSLKLEEAWPFIREEIEREIGSNQLVCIPHITEADFYKVSSVFVQNDKETDGKKFKPLGELVNIVDKEKSDPELVQWLEGGIAVDENYKFPHESVKITLQDEANKNKVRVILINFLRVSLPQGKLSGKKLYLDQQNPDLKGNKSVFIINKLLMAKTVEFRVTRGTSSRIFHLGNTTPLVFALEELVLGEDGQIEEQVPVEIKSKALRWTKVDPSDQLYTGEDYGLEYN